MRLVAFIVLLASLALAGACTEKREVRRRGFTTSADRYGQMERGHESPRWRMDLGPFNDRPNMERRQNGE